MNSADRLISLFDQSLRAIAGVAAASRPNPAQSVLADPDSPALDERQRSHSAALMRVNHVGEVCAQALYQSQALFAKKEAIREQFIEAGRDEQDHLAWTTERIEELGSRISLLNPLWYAGAFVMGAVAARMGDPASLGFVVETERQVEAHLSKHLESLPEHDTRSRAIVLQMREDEIRHGAAAQALGATDMPAPVKSLMNGVSKVMTTVAYYI